MKKFALMAIAVGLLALGGCARDANGNLTGQLTPTAQAFVKNVVTASCQVDQAIPGLVAAGGQVTALVAPEYADEVATVTKVEQLVHPAVVAACNAAATSSKPVAVTVTPAS